MTAIKTDMNEARKFAKGRKPVKRIWSQPSRPVLVRRKDVTPEAWDAVPVWRKYPKRLLDELNKGPCLTLSLRAAEQARVFVGLRKPPLDTTGWTNWKIKRARSSAGMKYFRRELERAKRAKPFPFITNL